MICQRQRTPPPKKNGHFTYTGSLVEWIGISWMLSSPTGHSLALWPTWSQTTNTQITNSPLAGTCIKIFQDSSNALEIYNKRTGCSKQNYCGKPMTTPQRKTGEIHKLSNIQKIWWHNNIIVRSQETVTLEDLQTQCPQLSARFFRRSNKVLGDVGHRWIGIPDPTPGRISPYKCPYPETRTLNL